MFSSLHVELLLEWNVVVRVAGITRAKNQSLIMARKESVYFVYILECSDKSLYTGITNNIERRFIAHKNGKGGHYTRGRRVVKFVYTETHPNRSSASKREAEIKSWKRKDKLALAAKTNRVSENI